MLHKFHPGWYNSHYSPHYSITLAPPRQPPQVQFSGTPNDVGAPAPNGGVDSCNLLYDQLAMQHTHLALEIVLAGFVRREFERDCFAGGKFRALVEIRKQHHL